MAPREAGVVMAEKVLGHKAYGSIPHLPNSRLGPRDYSITEGQARICTEKARDRFDRIIVQEKLDGSNVAVARVDGAIVALTRAGHIASTSKFPLHHLFYEWVAEHADAFDWLPERWRVCGEWLAVPHGTIYELAHEPFAAFDIFNDKNRRLAFDSFIREIRGCVATPYVVSDGPPIAVDVAMSLLGECGHHGATEPVEGVVYRVERKGSVDFLAKWVRPDKVDGKYLASCQEQIRGRLGEEQGRG